MGDNMSGNNELPLQVETSINAFVQAARAAFDNDLVSIVIYGSVAEGRMRATSDVNMLLVLKTFKQASADRLREPMRLAHAAVQLNAMFLLEAEVHAAMTRGNIGKLDRKRIHRRVHFCFQQKHRVQLHGSVRKPHRFTQPICAGLLERLQHQQHVYVGGGAHSSFCGRAVNHD